MHTRRMREGSASVDMTSMLDIALILLILFVVTAPFVQQWGIEINPSYHRPERPTFVAYIDASSRVWIADQQVPVSGVMKRIKTSRGEAFNGYLHIVANSQSRTEVLVTVMDQARMAGANYISVERNEM